MKKFLFLVLLPLLSFGQHTEFQFTKDTITDYVVVKCEGKTATELYNKTLNWISINYKNPKEVIKSQIENEYIRIEGSSNDLVVLKSISTISYLSRYQIEFYFKDGKFKMDVIRVEAYFPGSQYAPARWDDMNISNPKDYYKSNGDLKGTFKLWPNSFCTYFNNLIFDLTDFIKKDRVDKKDDKW